MSLLIVPLLYPDSAGLLNFSHPFQHNFRVADNPGATPFNGHKHVYRGQFIKDKIFQCDLVRAARGGLRLAALCEDDHIRWSSIDSLVARG
jgi:hypothetical protein